jgi:hypothetical protein
MKVKTSELQGAALDWAAAKCEGLGDFWLQVDEFSPQRESGEYHFSTDWSQAGPIIEREGVCMVFSPKDARGAWYAVMGKNRFLSPDFEGSGPKPLVAAMRCYVASKLGDEVEVPDEIIS